MKIYVASEYERPEVIQEQFQLINLKLDEFEKHIKFIKKEIAIIKENIEIYFDYFDNKS